jgi:hypothetical protein
MVGYLAAFVKPTRRLALEAIEQNRLIGCILDAGRNPMGGTMTRSKLTSFVLCLGVVVGITMGPAAAADKKAKEGQITGTVHMIDKDKSTLTVTKGTTSRQVIYNSDTKWMKGTEGSNKPASLDDLKENWYINCKGTFDGVKLVANACRFREAK